VFRLRVVLGYLGKLAIILGISMATSIGWAWYYGEDPVPHLISAVIACTVGAALLVIFRSRQSLNPKEGFALVALGWILASLLGTLPYFLSHTFTTFADAFFETVSGFTTTGASVLTDVEALPYSVLWWRSLTHWLGGMGIMMLFVAVIADIGGRANQIFHAELPGPLNDKLSPKVGESARILWRTYMVLSLLCVIMLVLGGMPVFDSLCHTFGALATGGFSIKNASIGYYNSYSQWVITLFTFLAGANFALHYIAWEKKSLMGYVRNREFRLYTFIVLAASLLILINLHPVTAWSEEVTRQAVFQVVTIITTTGYATADFNQWPDASRLILLTLMLIGGCAGSTSGAIKVGRIQIMLKQSGIELERMVHPQAVVPLRIGSDVIDKRLLINVLQFFFLYVVIITMGSIFLSFYDLDMITSLSAVISCLGNVGPGFNLVGPMSNYSMMPYLVKIFLSVLMLFGRLELFVLLLLLSPGFWRR